MIAFQKEMFLLHVTEVGLDEVAGLAMMAQEWSRSNVVIHFNIKTGIVLDESPTHSGSRPGISAHARPDQIWPWLVQMGQGRMDLLPRRLNGVGLFGLLIGLTIEPIEFLMEQKMLRTLKQRV